MIKWHTNSRVHASLSSACSHQRNQQSTALAWKDAVSSPQYATCPNLTLLGLCLCKLPNPWRKMTQKSQIQWADQLKIEVKWGIVCLEIFFPWKTCTTLCNYMEKWNCYRWLPKTINTIRPLYVILSLIAKIPLIVIYKGNKSNTHNNCLYF